MTALAIMMLSQPSRILAAANAWCQTQRKRQVTRGTAPALPWVYSVPHVALVSMCANSLQVVVWDTDDADPKRFCPACRLPHPERTTFA